MQASIAVAEALDAGKLTPQPVADAADFAVAGLAVAIGTLAVTASFMLVSFDARAGQGQLRRILDLGPSLCGPRLLLVFFVGLLAAAEMLRLPFFHGAMLPPRHHVMPCLAYPLVAHGIAEPGLLACVLLLLRVSVGGARLPASALVVPLACLPFLTVHVLVLATPATVAAYPGQLAHAADGIGHCAYPTYAATLLLALIAVYL
ncbi:uncharacterized protein [Zea mays]|jgi:hypothetical protein|uniref:Uncharacterized protein n=1 Tax=Zea mays TaxID=4577 RepID=A0A1D6KD07_MAIZE|nr:uncharacterized protein LOC103639267 [Zea mays]ONM01121.1 hypothetical protein ZEAMMB73_Zm00001d030566 [Zea mays]